MPKKRKKPEYFYTPETKAYYLRLKELLNSAGRLASRKALLFNLDVPSAHADCIRILHKYYDGDRGKLVRSIERKETELKEGDWRKFLAASDAAGIPRPIGDRTSPEYQYYKTFYDWIGRSEGDCDFRACMHKWCNDELAKIENGTLTVLPPLEEDPNREEVKVISVRDYLARYQRLRK